MTTILQLAERAAQGDRAAIDRLLELHLPAVRAFVRAHMTRQLRARESASDIVQSVCRELLTHQERFRHPSEGAFAAWLFTTARRKVQNRIRDLARQKRDAGREQPLGEGGPDVAALGSAYARFSSPSQGLMRREELERLELALEQLSPEHREVLTLAHLAGLSRAEIAAQMGRNEEAVRSMLYRAMAKLSLLLEAEPEHPLPGA
ncbi:MAG: sigma-70 family RNA polymerase sigma factor [Planctomycetes bacterium]|nr:sigma-70 family RNA polymerase sigma factor [Planctomycetota bacterium]